jgi:hypothetical protein
MPPLLRTGWLLLTWLIQGSLTPLIPFPDCMEKLGHFPMSENPEQFRWYIAPVLDEIRNAG